jgi:hypothetical protein
MADFPAQPTADADSSANQTASQFGSPSSRLSSRQYLEDLRARRTGKVSTQPVLPLVAQPTSMPVEQLTPTPPAPIPMTAEPSISSQVTPSAGELADNLSEDQLKAMPEQTIYEWTAPNRPFKKRNRQFYTTVGLITVLISLILFFAGQFLPIAVVISVAFLGYILSSIPPDQVTNKITTYGIRYDTTLFYWEELGRFWFEEKYGQGLVVIEAARFPGRVTLMLGNVRQDIIEMMLSEILIKQKPQDTFIDKSAQWLQEKVPLDM